MDWTESIFRIIELQTFSNIWYWIVVIVAWSVASNWLIGVPFDMLFRARKSEPAELADLEALVDIYVRRMVHYHETLGPYLVGLIAFLLAGLGAMGFYYQIMFAKGVFVLAAPLCLIGVINLRLALQLSAAPLHGQALVSRLFRVRLWTQVVAMIAMFFTAMYGMYQNLSIMFYF